MASPPSLPAPLQYLQPFLETLAQVPPDELDEVECTVLEDLLRQRIEGLDLLEAEQLLSDDRDLLEQWVNESSDASHPAYWLLGFLASPPHIVDELLEPDEEDETASVERTIELDPPSGWSTKRFPSGLELKHGQVWAIISAMDELSIQMQRAGFDNWVVPPPLEMILETEEVAFGEAVGTKYRILEVSPASKELCYLLKVPGGFVNVRIGHKKFADFDESALEGQLHTLRVETSG
ncbi:hypothetical protein NG895_04575 [Aeoliella sp. ICT_H6.2]|uniref:Uncharacterized protein n=1 Tax=Aeoliella straminimaris TaxID=2954799 RepID=A0A9X2FFJ3_9BACT|nr:hypothetical protein [Aeoliella straminimaris]MCO6043171.1 hypothetical protein [Aeoliella straminimaris]